MDSTHPPNARICRRNALKNKKRPPPIVEDVDWVKGILRAKNAQITSQTCLPLATRSH